MTSPLDGFRWNLIWGGLLYISLSRKSRFGSDQTQMSGTLHEYLNTPYYCQQHKFSIKHCRTTFSIFLLLRVICISATHRRNCYVSIATIATWTRHNGTLYVHCPYSIVSIVMGCSIIKTNHRAVTQCIGSISVYIDPSIVAPRVQTVDWEGCGNKTNKTESDIQLLPDEVVTLSMFTDIQRVQFNFILTISTIHKEARGNISETSAIRCTYSIPKQRPTLQHFEQRQSTLWSFGRGLQK